MRFARLGRVALRGAVARGTLLALLVGACSGGERSRRGQEEEPVEREPRERDGGRRPASPPPDPCGDDNPFCRDRDEPPPPRSCGNQQVDLTPAGVNVMIAVSGASSMASHWPRIQRAVRSLRGAHQDVRFGLQVFWGEVIEDQAQRLEAVNFCGQTRSRVLDVGAHSERELLDFLGTEPPGPTYRGGLLQTSPVIDPLNYYLANASALADPTRTNYLLFVTDGNDNCFGTLFTSRLQKLNAYKKLTIELGKRNIRVIPVGFDQAAEVATPGLLPVGGINVDTDKEVLATLLEYGGSGLETVPTVDDPEKLADVVAQVGQTIRNCRFAIPATLDPSANLNPFALDFLVNGLKVKRDRKKQDGWDFLDGDTSQVEMFGQACEAIRAGGLVEAHKTCADDVCGTASLKVETKPRAVLFLLDSSASRIACSDGSLTCLMVPDSPTRGTSLSYWEVVGLALGESLIAPINDDIEFGLQFFPGKSAGFLSCSVDDAPEIAPEPGSSITILRQLYEELPFGFSPVVQALESVAANPGRLAEPDVQGSVVMLTDGGDNCAGVAQDEIVRRLAGAARSLRERGVNTYVVRFGAPNGSTPEQEAQLRAIVENGGTAASDPGNPSQRPYVDAVDAEALTAALSTISNTLATCAIELGELPKDADREAVNLYLNGEVVPFDKPGTKASGWSWMDGAATTLELHGSSCEAFKTNRKTSIVVEFGCEAVFYL